jgi:hypothetical protein
LETLEKLPEGAVRKGLITCDLKVGATMFFIDPLGADSNLDWDLPPTEAII